MVTKSIKELSQTKIKLNEEILNLEEAVNGDNPHNFNLKEIPLKIELLKKEVENITNQLSIFSELEIKKMIILEEKAQEEKKKEIESINLKIKKAKENNETDVVKKQEAILKKLKEEQFKCEFNKSFNSDGEAVYSYQYKTKLNKVTDDTSTIIKNSPFNIIPTTSLESLERIAVELENTSEDDVVELVFDTETLDLTSGTMLEFGAILSINGEQKENIHFYTNPWLSSHKPKTKSVPKESAKIHNITKEMLEGGTSFDNTSELDNIARSFKDYAKIMKRIFDNSRLIAHNAKFDIGIMESEFSRCDIEEKISQNTMIIDTLSLFKATVSKAELEDMGLNGYNLNTFIRYIKIKYDIDTENKNRKFHGALLDSEILQEAFDKFRLEALPMIEMIEAEFNNSKETKTDKELRETTTENKKEKIISNVYFKTDRSINEGSVDIKEIVAKAKEVGIKSLTLMDTYKTNGHRIFDEEAKEAGIKPQYGSTIEILDENGKKITLNVIVKNQEGYSDLNRLITIGYENKKNQIEKIIGKKKKAEAEDNILPFITKSNFTEPDLKGRIASFKNFIVSIPENSENIFDTVEKIRDLSDLEKEDEVFIEPSSQIQIESYANKKANKSAKEICDDLNVKINVSTEVLYTNDSDFVAHKTLNAITSGKEGTGTFFQKKMEDKKAKSFNTSRISEEEKKKSLTQELNSDKITYEMGEKRTIFPKYPVKGETKEEQHKNILEEFVKSARDGLEVRILELNPTAEEKKLLYERLESEISIILSMEEAQKNKKDPMAYAEYFLFVKDYVNWSKDNKILIGPGRGSGAGSLIAYSMRITDVEVNKFDLVFERFINPERVSEPDFDIDFAGILTIEDIKDEKVKKKVKELRPNDTFIGGKDLALIYMSVKYPKAQVAKTLTEGKIQAKSAISDVCRIFGDETAQILFDNNPKLANMIREEFPSIKDTLRNVDLSNYLKTLITIKKDGSQEDAPLSVNIEKNKKFKQLYKSSHILRKILDISMKLENKIKSYGAHAGAVVLDFDIDKPIGIVNGEYVYFQTMYQSELVKFDFLGLRTLDVIEESLKTIKSIEGVDVDFKKIDYKDVDTFKTMGEGDTVGVFQIESDGMQSLNKDIKPDCVEDIIAILALYRPGPMEAGMLEDFKDRKNGAEIKYNLKEKDFDGIAHILKDILEPTLGVVVYQEQVMRIVREIAGFSLGDADLVRRAMGKKDAEKMAKLKDEFSTRATKYLKETQNIDFPVETASKLFTIIEKFAGYGFNKSHSAGYAQLTFQTQWLKTHYPVHFYNASFNNRIDDVEKLGIYMKDAVNHKIKIDAPNINESMIKFSIKDNIIKFGLEAIKGIGYADASAIIKERETNGEFKSLNNFLDRIFIKKSTMENLILTGAFDTIATTNEDIYQDRRNKLEEYYEYEKGQKKVVEKDKRTKRAHKNERDFFEIEKELLSHPLTAKNIIDNPETLKILQNQKDTLAEKVNKEGYINKFKTVLSSYKEIKTKAKKLMAFLTFTDGKTTTEAVCFDKAWGEIRNDIKSNQIVILDGRTQYSKHLGANQIVVNGLTLFDSEKEKKEKVNNEYEEQKNDLYEATTVHQSGKKVVFKNLVNQTILDGIKDILDDKYFVLENNTLSIQVWEDDNFGNGDVKYAKELINKITDFLNLNLEISEKELVGKEETTLESFSTYTIIRNIKDSSVIKTLSNISDDDLIKIKNGDVTILTSNSNNTNYSKEDLEYNIELIEKLKSKLNPTIIKIEETTIEEINGVTIIKNISDINIIKSIESIADDELISLNGTTVNIISSKEGNIKITDEELDYNIDIINQISKKLNLRLKEKTVANLPSVDSKELYKKAKAKGIKVYAPKGTKEINTIMLQEFTPMSIAYKIKNGETTNLSSQYFEYFTKQDAGLKPLLFILDDSKSIEEATKPIDANKSYSFIQFISEEAQNVQLIIMPLLDKNSPLVKALKLKNGMNKVKIGNLTKNIYLTDKNTSGIALKEINNALKEIEKEKIKTKTKGQSPKGQ